METITMLVSRKVWTYEGKQVDAKKGQTLNVTASNAAILVKASHAEKAVKPTKPKKQEAN